jgi:hypothetical protein
MLEEQGNLGGAVAQGRDPDVDHAQAVEEVLAEGARLDQRAQIPVGGGDQADVDLEGLAPAEG